MKALKKILFFIVFEIIFCSFLGVMLVFHGPFTNVRNAFVASAMTTMKHKYLATLFLSQSEIDKIMNENKAGIITAKENQNDIKVSTNNSPTDSNIKVINIKTNMFRGYLMEVSDPSKVGVGTSSDIGQVGMTLSQIVKNNNALGGINAGGFTDTHMTGTGGKPSGILIENGRLMYEVDSNVAYDVIGFNYNNVLVVGKYTYDQVKNMSLRDAVTFGPALIINGKPMIVNGDGGWGIGPRTAIGQKKDGTVLLLVIDGRETDSIGATLRDVENVMLNYGAYNAANLDGGSSATMYLNGKIINKPCDILGERSIPSAFIIR